MFAVLPFIPQSNTPSLTVPVLTVTETLFGRTWTVTASATGFPSPALSISFAVDGAATSIGDPSIAGTVYTWTYIVPSNLNPVSLAASVTAQNVAGQDAEIVTRSVPADLITPSVVADFAQATYTNGESVTADDLLRSITNAGAPALTDVALTLTLRVNGSPVTLPYTAVSGAVMVHRVSWTHPATGATFVDSPSRTVVSATFAATVESDQTLTLTGVAGETHRIVITNPAEHAGTYDITWPASSAAPVIVNAGEIAGEPVVGATLSELYQALGLAASGFSTARQWRRDGSNISGATAATFVTANTGVHLLRHSVTDANGTTNSDTNSITVASAATAEIVSVTYSTAGLLVEYEGTLSANYSTAGISLEVA